MSNLSDFFNRAGNVKGFNPVDSFSTRKQTLPYTGETFDSPVVAQGPFGYTPYQPPRQSVTNLQNIGYKNSFLPQTQEGQPQAGQWQGPVGYTPYQPTQSPQSPQQGQSLFGTGSGYQAQPERDKYYSPELGRDYTPKEYADMLASKIPVSSNKGDGDIGQTAGDALLFPNQSASTLESTARGLNNARNDIATGTTDPYRVGAKSDFDYSPAQLNAIEKAYAGIYDPALEDVFTRLKQRQQADKDEQDRLNKIAEAAQKREDQIFATDENIRQWRATTGSRASSGGGGADTFTDSQINSGAANAGMTISEFKALDEDLMNFFINPVKVDNDGTMVTQQKLFQDLLDQVKEGQLTPDEVNQMITDSSTLNPAVKHYFIAQIPEAPEKKDAWYKKIWGMATGAVDYLTQ